MRYIDGYTDIYFDLEHPFRKYFGGGGGGGPKVAPAPSPIPRKVEVNIEAAKREERELAERRRGRFASVFTRGKDLGIAETSKSALLGL